jgi:hypothetical protein
MPSEDGLKLALDVLRVPLQGFHSTLVATADEVRSYLASRQASWEAQVARVGHELGPLAAGRIDVERFATLFANHRDEADTAVIEPLEHALAVLGDLAARSDVLCVAETPAGGSLYEAVARALAEIGRAFAAAALVAEIRAGRFRPGREAPPLGPFPFARWTRPERRLAPPLVARVHGADLRAASLAEFLDGRQKIVLVVAGECSPAPLVRLVAPGTFVVQTVDRTHLDRLVAWDGAGIAAIVPESAARFVHDPLAGPGTHDRLRIEHLPDRAPRRALGGLSAAQQAEELLLLQSLAAPPAGAPASAGPPSGLGAPAPADPAERLAAWLLRQADLSNLG